MNSYPLLVKIRSNRAPFSFQEFWWTAYAARDVHRRKKPLNIVGIGKIHPIHHKIIRSLAVFRNARFLPPVTH